MKKIYLNGLCKTKVMSPIICMIICIIPFTLFGQRYISGRIIDAGDGNPVPAVTVFFTNTTVGITTDSEGYYRLRIPGEGSYSLTVSHVGYQTVVKDIEHGIESIVYDVTMQIQELDEIDVSTRVRFRRNDINLFWRTILGKNPSRRTIQAKNPETVYYYFNPETRILKVTCREPLQIVNYETGYHIQCVLENFTHNYNTGLSDWSYQCVFTELKPANIRQKNNWEEKRVEVYKVSLTKFIKSLYNNSLEKDGFVLADFYLSPDPSNPFRLSMLTQDKIISTVSAGNGKILNLSNRQTLLLCYGRPVTDDDWARLERLQHPEVRFESSSYTIGGEFGFLSAQNPQEQLENIGLYRNLLQGQSIRIFPDGTYEDKFWMTPINSSETLFGLSLRLPLEYLPEGPIPSAMASNSISEDEHSSKYDFAGVNRSFHEQVKLFPQEKIHLHTDRDIYVSGEKIWFKAYITDALTHQNRTDSRYVYVELISPVDTLIHRVMIRPVDGMYYGNLPLREYVPTGNYTLRAYTRYMENLGDDYFFKKNIRIENLSSDINQQRSTTNRVMLLDDFHVSFFPEGGNLPEGVLSRIAFKAININGYPEIISGKLIDETGVEITSVETFYAGMGVFDYMPETKKRIYLICKNRNGLEKRFELPQPDSRAYSLTVVQRKNDLLIDIRRSVNSLDIPCYLLAHCRGEVLYFSKWDKEKEGVAFEEEELPAGIIQFVLFDEQLNPLSERLVFSKNYDEAKVVFSTDKTLYKKREKVIATLSLADSDENILAGHLSVAITDNMDVVVDSLNTILSSLLLSSELRGYIENPAWYLQDNAESVIALDYLMLTHGWRRYAIPDIVKGNSRHPPIPFQTSQQISGKVNSLRSRPLEDSEISILTKEGDFGLVSADGQGNFMFHDFEYPDSTSFYIQALSRRGSDRVELVVDDESFPKIIHAIQSPFVEMPIIREETKEAPEEDTFIKKAEQRARYDEDMWVIHLDEVVVTARIIKKQDESHLQYWANTSADITIQREEIERTSPQYVTDLLTGVAGVYSSDGYANIRNSGSLYSVYPPLVLIDGIPTIEWPRNDKDEIEFAYPGQSPLEQVSVQDVERIDIFRGENTAIFGVRGAGGVISITTRKGIESRSRENEEYNYIVYTPLGYQKALEFYSPNYETLEARYLTIPDFRTTIFWKPNIIISDDEVETTFEFYTSDFPTTYSVVIEGLASDGRIIRKVEKVRVE